MKIVVSGDTFENAERIRRYLASRAGQEVVLPKNPISGPYVASIAEHERPDLLLLDSELLQVDALGVLGSLRRRGYAGRVVLMAGSVSPKLCEEARRLRVERILPKPFELSELSDLLLPSAFHTRFDRLRSADPLYSLLRSAGLSAKFYGSLYLEEAIRKAAERPELIHRITTEMYPTVARAHDSLPSRVERCMRHAIELAWRRGDPLLYYDVLGYCNDGNHAKPCNSEFIAAFSQYLSIWEANVQQSMAEEQA